MQNAPPPPLPTNTKEAQSNRLALALIAAAKDYLMRRSLGRTAILVGATAVLLAGELLFGSSGCVSVEPGEAAVVYNHTPFELFGPPARTSNQQGLLFYIPGIHTVETLERRPQVFLMSSASGPAAQRLRRTSGAINTAESLTVRANDGSNFYFDRLEIHYQVRMSSVSEILRSSGPGDIYKHHLIAVHAREILRDEFGRFDFLEIADPTTYGRAKIRANQRLNDRLADYGLQVTQIVTPKPRFEPDVEKAIEDRQNAEQEVEVQREKRLKLEQHKGRLVQAIEQEKNVEYQTLLAQLEANKKAAHNQLLSTQREADKYHIEREAEGIAYQDEKLTRAKANAIAYRKEAEGLVAKVKALGAQGPDVLNSVIAESVLPQLEKVSATPLLMHAAPIDIRHISDNHKPSSQE